MSPGKNAPFASAPTARPPSTRIAVTSCPVRISPPSSENRRPIPSTREYIPPRVNQTPPSRSR